MNSRKVSEIIWREDLYPRINPDPATVQKYAENIDVLPPIEINQNNELIDGFHRWTAHRKVESQEIAVTITPTKSDAELLKLAIVRNAAHGLQLSNDDKKTMARRLYASNGNDKAELAAVLSVTERTVRNWVHDIDRARKEERDRKIFDMWLACFSLDEIAEAVEENKMTVSRSLEDRNKLENFPKSYKLVAEFGEPDWTPPIYNIWSFAKKSNAVSHFGNTEARIVENLLYLFTKPFDIIVDPFAGGGSTIDVCKRRLRRYWVSDRKPIVERENEIRRHDIATDGISGPYHWSDVSLVYLDPPYWKQAEGKYSEDSTDLSNMPLDGFTSTLSGLINDYGAKLRTGARIAMIIQPTQWNAPGREVVDHVLDIVRNVGLKLEYRISAPYSTEQYTPQMVDWAKENNKLLVLTREVIVWQV